MIRYKKLIYHIRGSFSVEIEGCFWSAERGDNTERVSNARFTFFFLSENVFHLESIVKPEAVFHFIQKYIFVDILRDIFDSRISQNLIFCYHHWLYLIVFVIRQPSALLYVNVLMIFYYVILFIRLLLRLLCSTYKCAYEKSGNLNGPIRVKRFWVYLRLQNTPPGRTKFTLPPPPSSSPCQYARR